MHPPGDAALASHLPASVRELVCRWDALDLKTRVAFETFARAALDHLPAGAESIVPEIGRDRTTEPEAVEDESHSYKGQPRTGGPGKG